MRISAESKNTGKGVDFLQITPNSQKMKIADGPNKNIFFTDSNGLPQSSRNSRIGKTSSACGLDQNQAVSSRNLGGNKIFSYSTVGSATDTAAIAMGGAKENLGGTIGILQGSGSNNPLKKVKKRVRIEGSTT